MLVKVFMNTNSNNNSAIIQYMLKKQREEDRKLKRQVYELIKKEKQNKNKNT